MYLQLLQGTVGLHVTHLTCILTIKIYRFKHRADNFCTTNVCDFVSPREIREINRSQTFLVLQYFHSSR